MSGNGNGYGNLRPVLTGPRTHRRRSLAAGARAFAVTFLLATLAIVAVGVTVGLIVYYAY